MLIFFFTAEYASKSTASAPVSARPLLYTVVPSSDTFPESGCDKPAIMRDNVVFPEPLSPTRQTHSPCRMQSDMLSSAAAAALLYTYVTVSSTTAGGAVKSAMNVSQLSFLTMRDTGL